MPIRNDYGPLRSADTGTVMQLPADAIAIRVDWNKRSADSLSPWRVISEGRMMNKLRTRQTCRVQFERCGTSYDCVAQYISLLLQAHPKMAGTVVVE